MSRSRHRIALGDGLAAEALEARCLLSAWRPSPSTAEVRRPWSDPSASAIPRLFVMPDAGRGPILQAIASARSEIRVGICNIGDPEIVDALIEAERRGVVVKVIVDRADYLAKPPEQELVAALLSGGVAVHLSNPVFPQSFPKYLIVDRRQILIMTLCIVPPTFTDTRDYGVLCFDPQVIRQVASIFETDWAHSAPPGETPPPGNPTPAVRLPNLIVGPVNAGARLSRLIASARRTIDATSEVVDDPVLEAQLVAAVERGVRVRLIAPVVSRANNDNLPALDFLSSRGVLTHVTTELFPDPDQMPYMHAKTMVVDGRVVYVGSIDLDATQTSQDRELGIILAKRLFVGPIARRFESDWSRTGPPQG